MPLWGTTDGTKPKWLTDAEKEEVFATASGYVVEPGSKMTGNGNVNAQPEVLVALGDLATKIGAATITEIEFMTTAFSKGAGGTISMRVRYNEEVTVTGTHISSLITQQTQQDIKLVFMLVDQVLMN